MPSEPAAVLADLKAGRIAPLYFLQGEEAFFLDEIIDWLDKNALPEAERGFNQMVLYGRDTTVREVISRARSFPMMGERQVILVKEAQELSDLGQQEAQGFLDQYAQSPMPTTVLAFAYKGKTLDGRKALVKTLDKQAVLVTTKRVYDNQVPQWLHGVAKAKGHPIDDKAAALMQEAVGADLSRLAKELDKLAIHLEKGQPITAELVSQHVGISREYNVFELQTAILQRDSRKAFTIAHQLGKGAKSGDSIGVVAILSSFFSKLLIVHGSPDKSERGVMEALGLRSAWFAKDYMVALRNYPLGRMPGVLGALRKADAQAKGIDSPSRDEAAILNELVLGVLGA